MWNDSASSATAAADRKQQQRKDEKRHLSIFDVPSDLFDSCRLLQSPSSLPEPPESSSVISAIETPGDEEQPIATAKALVSRWSCNTCKGEFESLADQRAHFKSDVHRFNVKLTIAGKDTVKEEDFDELASDSLFKDYDISSISGSEDEAEKGTFPSNYVHSGLNRSVKQKLFIRLQRGERVSLWKCLLLDEAENILFENDNIVDADDGGSMPCLREKEVIERLNFVIHEPRDNTRLRVVFLASGGHFAGCVFDGNSVVAHKTFHRYVVRAKAGKKQSSKDATGRAAHSAGASLRRYNELALKKEIQELLAAWKPYFDASLCVFIYAPSDNHQLLFDGEKPYFSCKHCIVRSVPLTVRRPTLKEARRVYKLLTQVTYEVEENASIIKEDSVLSVSIANECFPGSTKEDVVDNLGCMKITEVCSGVENSEILSISSESVNEVVSASTPLHEAAKCGNEQKVLELLEQGSDPCIVDERGRTPYMLATEKEVRNIFRRFMASNLDKWDWNTAKVPSALTKEMEESQAAKQAEKDAKRKARAKELKKLRKEKEKKAQADAASSQSAPTISANRVATPITLLKGQSQSSIGAKMSKEEELKRAQALEREKRAAAAERRIAVSQNAQEASASNVSSSSSQPKGVVTTDIKCSCCNSSLVGKVPFHRYNYKYCSTSCMHVHKEMLEDG